MDELYKKYKNGNEFEFRVNITAVQFKNILNHISNKDKYVVNFENSVSVALDRQRLIRKVFDRRGNPKVYYMYKKELGRHFFKHSLYGAVKTILVDEIPGKKEDFKATNIVSIRVKPRVSIILEDEPDWRFDFTPSKEFKKIYSSQQIKAARDEMFVWAKDLNEYIEKIDLDAITGMIELEIEYIGTGTPRGSDINSLFGLITPEIQDATNTDYHKALERIVTLLKQRRRNNPTIKQVSNQVVSMSYVNFRDEIQAILHSFDVKFKTDGDRALVLIEENIEHVLTSKEHQFESKHAGPTIYDGELITDDDGKVVSVRFWDVVMWEGEDLTGKAYHLRKKYFDRVAEVSAVGKKKVILSPRAGSAGKQIAQFYDKKPPYKIDGLIFTPRFGQYFTMKVYKWKPNDQMTIDFLIKRCPVSMAGKKPYVTRPNKTTYLLFCGAKQAIRHKFIFPPIRDYHTMFPTIANADYRPTLFRHPQNHYNHIYYDARENLDNKVGEFIRRPNGDWELVRIREDRQLDVQSGRYFGNDYAVASSNYDNYYDPITLADMAGAIDHGYFAGDNQDYADVRKFNSFVKEHLIHDQRGAKSVIDFAAGQGQDLMRYSKMDVEKLLAIDIDRHAIARLNSRRFNIPNPMAIWTMITDLSLPKGQNYSQIIRHFEIPQHGVDFAVCNLALHYLSKTQKSLKNFLDLVTMLLGKDKPFLATFFDGQSVVDLVNEHKGEWRVNNPEDASAPPRYSIKGARNLKNWGSTVELILPFSDGKYYSEPLINYLEFKKTAEKSNFEVRTGMFSDYFEKSGMPKIEGDDRIFAGLYRWVILTHKKEPKKLVENLRALT